MWDAWSLGRASWEPIIAICEVLREVVGTCVRCCNAAAACAEAGTSVARLALHLASFLFFFFPSFRRHTHTHTRTHTLSTPVPPCVLAWLTLPPHNAPLSVRQAPVDNCVYVATRAPLQKKKRNRIPFFFYIFILLPQQVLAFFSFFFFTSFSFRVF